MLLRAQTDRRVGCAANEIASSYMSESERRLLTVLRASGDARDED